LHQCVMGVLNHMGPRMLRDKWFTHFPYPPPNGVVMENDKYIFESSGDTLGGSSVGCKQPLPHWQMCISNWCPCDEGPAEACR